MGDVELPNPEELGELKEKHFTRAIALTTAITAVVLAFCSLGGDNAGKDMMLAQQQASDSWAFYQAKVIREHMYRIERIRLETEIASRGGSIDPEASKKLAETKDAMAAEEERYGKDKKEIEAKAKELEAERDANRERDPYFDWAEVLLQISIVMASIAILTGSRGAYAFALTLAGLGTFLTIDGYTLVWKLGFLG